MRKGAFPSLFFPLLSARRRIVGTNGPRLSSQCLLSLPLSHGAKFTADICLLSSMTPTGPPRRTHQARLAKECAHRELNGGRFEEKKHRSNEPATFFRSSPGKIRTNFSNRRGWIRHCQTACPDSLPPHSRQPGIQ